jgi:hypothetical protein
MGRHSLLAAWLVPDLQFIIEQQAPALALQLFSTGICISALLFLAAAVYASPNSILFGPLVLHICRKSLISLVFRAELYRALDSVGCTI